MPPDVAVRVNIECVSFLLTLEQTVKQPSNETHKRTKQRRQQENKSDVAS